MLDKSLIYKDIVMCLPFEELKSLKVPVLPDGYSYRMFEPGDEDASPVEQGKGLGKAIVLFALSRFLVVEPDADFIFLHTHTWAYKAVGMYQKMGFRITKKALPTSRTDFSCMDVLKDVLPDSIISHLLEKD